MSIWNNKDSITIYNREHVTNKIIYSILGSFPTKFAIQ